MECGETAPDKVILWVDGDLDTTLAWRERRVEATGRDSWGLEFPRVVPEGWRFELVDRRISHLADVTTRRYVAAVFDEWCAGHNVCRACRDGRLPEQLLRWANR